MYPPVMAHLYWIAYDVVLPRECTWLNMLWYVGQSGKYFCATGWHVITRYFICLERFIVPNYNVENGRCRLKRYIYISEMILYIERYMLRDVMIPHYIYIAFFLWSLEGFVVTIKDEVSIGLDALHARVRMQCDNTNRPVLIMVRTWQF